MVKSEKISKIFITNYIIVAVVLLLAFVSIILMSFLNTWAFAPLIVISLYGLLGIGIVLLGLFGHKKLLKNEIEKEQNIEIRKRIEARTNLIMQTASAAVLGGGLASGVISGLNTLAAVILLASLYIGFQLGYLPAYQEYTDKRIREEEKGRKKS